MVLYTKKPQSNSHGIIGVCRWSPNLNSNASMIQIMRKKQPLRIDIVTIPKHQHKI